MACAKGVEIALPDDLKCPICRNILDHPKLIPCSHTFCHSCLVQLHRIQANGSRIRCPVCRAPTDIADGDVTQFPTNLIAKSLAEEFLKESSSSSRKAKKDRITGQRCTVCDEDDADVAKVYCQKCTEFLCESCLLQHDRYKRNASHDTVPAEDILSGKVFKKSTCREHPEELEQWVCITCLAYVCAICCEINHTGEGHEILSVCEWQNNNIATVEVLQERAQRKLVDLEEYEKVIQMHVESVKGVIEQRKREIENAYEDLERQLAIRKATLLVECTQYEQRLCHELKSIGESNESIFSAIIQKISQVFENTPAVRDNKSVRKQAELCSELENMLAGDICDKDLPHIVASRVHYLTFNRSGEPNSIRLGTVHIKEWEIKREVDIGKRDSLCYMSATQDNRMAVGSRNGSIQFFTVDGEREENTDQCLTGARGLGFLTDGRCVVRDNDNKVCIFTHHFDPIDDIVFQTLSKNEGGVGGVAVGRDDRIYVDYRKAKKIQVFTPAGGPAIHEILCDSYEPWQVFSMASNDTLLVLSHSNSVRVIDETGRMKHAITKCADAHVFPAIGHGGCVLLASIDLKKSELHIEKYSSQLEYSETLVANYPVQVAARKWYYLQEFTSGDIALCTPDRLYIFTKLVK